MEQSVKSTHRVEVVPVRLEPHENADSLSIVRIFGYIAVVRTEDWQNIHKGAYVTPDSMLPNIPPFAFLFTKESHNTRFDIAEDGACIKNKEDGKYVRITVRRFRGIYSQGLLIPAPENSQIGDDVAQALGVKRYEPFLAFTSGGESERPPPNRYIPSYDVDSFNRYGHLFKDSEAVHVSEKIHGASGRWCYHEERMWAGSRREWKKHDKGNLWWKALASHPEIEEFCKAHPNITVFGEVYGAVQKLKYGISPGQVRIAVFDLLQGALWIPVETARKLGEELPWVPVVTYGMPFDEQKLRELAEGKSLINGADNIREGIVVKPLQERTNPEIGRVQLKLVSNRYLEGKRR